MNLADRLSAYVCSLAFDDLSPGAIHAAKQRVVDSLGCAIGGADSLPAKSVCEYLASMPSGASTVLFSDRKVAPELAAFANALMVRFLDYNDGYFGLEPGHPSDNISACLAVAEAEGCSGQDLILSIAIAYEAQMQLQDAACLFKRGWDHVNYVLVSSVLAVGRLLNLNQHQLVQAISMALNGHIAMRQVRSGELSSWKGASAGNASRNAVFCAYLARYGMTGPSDIFEGEMGFFNQISGEFELDPARFARGKRDTYRIEKALTKLYPTNGEMQSAVMAAVELRERIGELRNILAIEVDTTDVGYRFLAKDIEKWKPTTRETADHSLPYTVARAFVDGCITRESYSESKLIDPLVLELMSKMQVKEDPSLSKQMPRSLPNRVSVHLRDGSILVEEVGTSKNPRIGIPDDEIERKFRQFANGRISPDGVRRALDFLWGLDQKDSYDEFFRAIKFDPNGAA